MKIAVLGAGHGGLATAGHIASKGHNVNLFSFYKQENAHPDGRRILENFFRMNKKTGFQTGWAKGKEAVEL